MITPDAKQNKIPIFLIKKIAATVAFCLILCIFVSMVHGGWRMCRFVGEKHSHVLSFYSFFYLKRMQIHKEHAAHINKIWKTY